MTGIERLRELVGGIGQRSVWSVTREEYDNDHGLDIEHRGGQLRDLLADIADQIERERACDGDTAENIRLIVGGVIDDMERHVSGVEGMEDSPVARWARELREALGGEERDPAADVSVSVYDLLPQEEREAIAWVREHGGLDGVKKLLDWVVGHCSTEQQLDFDFWLSGRVMHELGFEEDMADRDEVERRLLARLMPEGYEWLRYESGEPLRYEDRYVYDGRECEVWHVDFDSYGEPTILNKDGTRFHPDKGERVKRPAPKVLDADGVEIRVGDEVWHVRGEFGPRFVSKFETHDGRPVAVFEPNGTDLRGCECDQLTHRAPVLAADGKPLREGETVWDKQTGRAATVKGFDRLLGEPCAVIDFAGIEQRVRGKLLTHERPVADTWERLEEDAGCTATKYNERRGTIFTTKQQVARDLVRRCRALAERERGE